MDILPSMDDADLRHPHWVYRVGTEPDPRFSMANERTLLSWIRTGSGFAAGGGGLLLTRDLLGPDLTTFLSTSAFALAAVVVAGAILRWVVTERALRLDRAMPSPLMAMSVGGAMLVGGLVGMAATLLWR